MKSVHKLGLIVAFVLSVGTMVAQGTLNSLDINGKKDGLWKGVYEASKRPRYEGTFSHGKEIGLFKFYDDTKASTVIATREFNEKDNSAYTIFYDQANNKVSEGKVINKLFEGEWKYYHQASKTIMTTENYKNGKLEGIRTVFYPNGKIAEEVNYKNNQKNGLSKIYAADGVVLEEVIYKNDKYNGLAIFRDPLGNVVSKGQFVDDKKWGIWEFFEQGKKTKEMNMTYPEKQNKGSRN
jgi:antitoxin component YwqK of YwqJK toxin-antitoxin module